MYNWVKECVHFIKCDNYSQYSFIGKPKPIFNIEYTSHQPINIIEYESIIIEFDKLFHEKIIYDEFLDIINNDNIELIEKNINGINDLKIGELIYTYIVESSKKIWYNTNFSNANFIIINEYFLELLNLYESNEHVLPLKHQIIVDDIGYILVGRKGDDLYDNTIKCFHNDYNMTFVVPSEDTYENYIKINFYNILKQRKEKIDKLLKLCI